MAPRGLYIGLMSGTSVDAIDAALVEFTDDSPRLQATLSQPLPDDLRQRIFALSRGDAESVDELCRLDREIGDAFAAAVNRLLEKAGTAREKVHAVGSHGQTIRHHPRHSAGPGYTLQIGDPNSIAEGTGICTVADFRRRDVAAGGEGAPLVPPFHAAVFGAEGYRRAIVNIGGIANVTLLRGREVAGGYDCGPGNTLLDAWIAQQRGESYDAHGAWSAEHDSDETLLSRLLEDDFFRRSGPRSTGPERFNLRWLAERLTGEEAPGTVQATLAELTARAICGSLPGGSDAPEAVFVCGGGARNTDLMRRLHRALNERQMRLGTTDELGIQAEWVEASAFAWLAAQTLAGLPGNAPVVTGASGGRVLGAIYAGLTGSNAPAANH